MPPPLVGYWNLDEGSGTTAADSSGNGNTGTLSGTAAWAAPPPSTDVAPVSFSNLAAVTGDGTTNQIAVGITGFPATLNLPISIAMWVNLATVSGGSFFDFFELVSAGPAGYHFGQAFGSGICVQGINATPDLLTIMAVFTTGWHHVAWTYDGTTDTLYVDGAPVGTGTVSHVTNAITSATIGGSIAGNSPWDGTVDDVRVYAGALSAADVALLAAGGGGPSSSPPSGASSGGGLIGGRNVVRRLAA